MNIDILRRFEAKHGLNQVNPLDLHGLELAGKSATNRDSPKYFGYIYEVVCEDSLKDYVGKHSCLRARKCADVDRYIGSGGPHYQNALKKYGLDHFHKFILDVVLYDPARPEAELRADLNEKERQWIEHRNNQDDKVGYNLLPGGEGSWDAVCKTNKGRRFVHKDGVERQVKPEDLDQYLADGYILGMSDATRKKMSENSPIKGIGHTLATRQKMSKNSVGKNLGKKRTAEQRAERSRLQTGKMWVNDGKLTTFVRPEEAESLVSKGWSYGRLRASEETKKKFTELRTGRVWVHNGASQRFVTKGEAEVLLSEGFVMGRGKMAR